MDEIIGTADSVIDNQISPEVLFRLVDANRDTYLLFLMADMGDLLLGEMTKKLCEQVAQENLPERMRMAFWAGALYGLIKQWFLERPDLSAEEMTALYRDLAGDLFSTRT